MLKGSKEDLLKRTKETVTEPFTKQVEILRKQVELLSKDSTEKLSALRQTTINLDKKSDDVKGAAMQLTSALRSPNVKGRWGEVNLKRILEFVGLINYCDFDEQVSIETEEKGKLRPDCVITIPGSRRLIVDSKAPIESYLDAIKATDKNLNKDFESSGESFEVFNDLSFEIYPKTSTALLGDCLLYTSDAADE